jgi:hypothetical protein
LADVVHGGNGRACEKGQRWTLLDLAFSLSVCSELWCVVCSLRVWLL